LTETAEMDLEQKKLTQVKTSSSKFKRIIYSIVGYVSLTLGIIGLIFPILPTTPFLLVAAACFARNSEKAYNWLIHNRIFGKFIRDYRAGKGIPIKVKIYTLFFLWITIFISIFFISIFWIQILLFVIASLVSIHIIMIKPKSRKKG